mmetsp:Transcript_298/g.720  ORF Transcript_298/g.720 Transcript_298/m.720 type:complete len:248 (-) Transcript_298:47-790(-)
MGSVPRGSRGSLVRQPLLVTCCTAATAVPACPHLKSCETRTQLQRASLGLGPSPWRTSWSCRQRRGAKAPWARHRQQAAALPRAGLSRIWPSTALNPEAGRTLLTDKPRTKGQWQARQWPQPPVHTGKVLEAQLVGRCQVYPMPTHVLLRLVVLNLRCVAPPSTPWALISVTAAEFLQRTLRSLGGTRALLPRARTFWHRGSTAWRCVPSAALLPWVLAVPQPVISSDHDETKMTMQPGDSRAVSNQ